MPRPSDDARPIIIRESAQSGRVCERTLLKAGPLYTDYISTLESSRDYSGASASLGHSASLDSDGEIYEPAREARHRDPIDARKYVPCTYSKSRSVEIINHQRKLYDFDEPRASHATSHDYRMAKARSIDSKQENLQYPFKLPELRGSERAQGKAKEDLPNKIYSELSPKPLLATNNAANPLIKDVTSRKKGITVMELNEGLENSVLEISDQLSTDTEQTDDDSSRFDELCDELEQLQIEGIVSSNPVENTLDHDSIERFAQRFWDEFNHGWTTVLGSAEKQSSSSPADTSGSSGDSRVTLSSQNSRSLGKKRRRSTDEEKDGESGEENRRPRGKRPPGDKEPCYEIRFACPFRKHDPHKYRLFTHRPCVISHWPTIPRLKEHLYRCHQKPIYCGRCKITFNNESEKREHEMAADGCSPSRQAPDGLTETQLKSLKSRTKNPLHKCEVDRWNGIYSILFPGEDIPSPNFQAAPEASQQSSHHSDLEGFKAHVRKEMDRCARTHLAILSNQRDKPFSNTEMENLITAFQSCQEDLLKSYSGQNGSRPDTQILASMSGNAVAGLSSASPDTQRSADIFEDSQHPMSEDQLLGGSQPSAILPTESQLKSSDYDYLNPPQISSEPLWSDSGYCSMQFCTCPSACIIHEDEAAYLGPHPKLGKGATRVDSTEASAEWEQWLAYDP